LLIPTTNSHDELDAAASSVLCHMSTTNVMPRKPQSSTWCLPRLFLLLVSFWRWQKKNRSWRCPQRFNRPGDSVTRLSRYSPLSRIFLSSQFLKNGFKNLPSPPYDTCWLKLMIKLTEA
jgi:hypothetical protein